MATRGGFWVVHISLRGLFALSPVEKIFWSIFMKDRLLDLSNLTGIVWQTQWCCTSLFYIIVYSLLSSLDNSTWFLPTYIRNFIYLYLCIVFVIGKLIFWDNWKKVIPFHAMKVCFQLNIVEPKILQIVINFLCFIILT
jgi:hypothetical protein